MLRVQMTQGGPWGSVALPLAFPPPGFKRPPPVGGDVPQDSLEALSDILQVLANPARLALLRQLQTPKRVADLTVTPSREDAGLTPERAMSRQSLERHLDILAEAGLVTWREGEGRTRGAKEYVLNHARLFAAVEELRGLSRLRATVAAPEQTMDLAAAPGPDPEAVPGPRLVLLRGVPEGRIVPLEGEATVLGRGGEATLRLDHDPFVSQRHCVLRRARGQVTLADEGTARNGTLLNGRRLKAGEAAVLRRGNLVGVGRSLLLYLD